MNLTRVVDLAGVPTRFSAADVARAEAIEAVVADLRPHRDEPVLEVAFGARAVALPSEAFEHADGDVRAWWKGDDLLLRHGSLAAHVGSATAYIGGEGDLARGFRQLLPYVITHLLAPHERFVLHAGAIERGHRAVVVAGGTGSGKSTLVVSAVRAGWSALADDLVAVRLGRDGPEVMGIAKPLAVPVDVIETSQLPTRPIPGDPRGRWQVDVAANPAWYPIATTVVSSHGETTSGELRHLTSEELVEWLLFSFLSRHERSRLRRYLPVAAALTCRQGWELRHGSDPSTRVEQVDALLRQLPVPGTVPSG